MPWFWRLPEREMLGHAQPAPNYRSLSTLDTEGMMLHALMHCAAHLFGCGLKAAWDVAWLLEREPGPRRRSACAHGPTVVQCPAGFYLPAKVIHDSLDVAIPAKLLERVPNEPRFGPLERVARLRLFVAMEGAVRAQSIYDSRDISDDAQELARACVARGVALRAATRVSRAQSGREFTGAASRWQRRSENQPRAGNPTGGSPTAAARRLAESE
jgi:hypothetical protein